jgi:hypothetical protein
LPRSSRWPPARCAVATGAPGPGPGGRWPRLRRPDARGGTRTGPRRQPGERLAARARGVCEPAQRHRASQVGAATAQLRGHIVPEPRLRRASSSTRTFRSG